jgi:hypothetical protein
VIAASGASQKLSSDTLAAFVVAAIRLVLKGCFECNLNIRECSIIQFHGHTPPKCLRAKIYQFWPESKPMIFGGL